MKNNESGFIGLLVVVLSLAILGAVSYGAYNKNTFGVRNYIESRTQKENASNQNTVNNSVVVEQKNITPEVVVKNLTGEAVVNPKIVSGSKVCQGDWDCFIAAANQCETASGTFSFSNIEYPYMKGLQFSGQTKYEMIKNGTTCKLTYAPVTGSMAFSPTGRADMIKQGVTEAQINEQLKVMNDSLKLTIGLATNCVSTSSIIGTYLKDQKNGYIGEVSASADLQSSKSVITTSSGQKLTCIAINRPY